MGYGRGADAGAPLSTPTPVSDAEFDTRGLIARFSVGVVLLLVGFAILGAVLREPVESAARVWVDTTGLAGMFAAIAVLDSVPSPVPPDLFTGFAYVGGLDFWTIAVVASAASVTGGTSAWAVARWFSQTRWFQAFIRERGKQAYALVQRYGMIALVLGAVSPLPFSLTCYGPERSRCRTRSSWRSRCCGLHGSCSTWH